MIPALVPTQVNGLFTSVSYASGMASNQTSSEDNQRREIAQSIALKLAPFAGKKEWPATSQSAQILVAIGQHLANSTNECSATLLTRLDEMVERAIPKLAGLLEQPVNWRNRPDIERSLNSLLGSLLWEMDVRGTYDFEALLPPELLNEGKYQGSFLKEFVEKHRRSIGPIIR